MLAESLVYALAMGAVVIYAMNFAAGYLQPPRRPARSSSASASPSARASTKKSPSACCCWGWATSSCDASSTGPAGPAYFVAVVFAAAVFSLCHFHFPHFEDFEADAFFFRFGAGVVLGAIFCLRGIGVAIYTHALYNVILILKGLQ